MLRLFSFRERRRKLFDSICLLLAGMLQHNSISLDAKTNQNHNRRKGNAAEGINLFVVELMRVRTLTAGQQKEADDDAEHANAQPHVIRLIKKKSLVAAWHIGLCNG